MKFKQKIALGLCVFYVISVIGIALSLHFCGGKLSSVNFTEQAKCNICKTNEKSGKEGGCCKNTTVAAKVTDCHQCGSKVDLPKNFGLKLFFGPILHSFAQYMFPSLVGNSENKAPPLSSRVSLYLYNCVFRN